MRVVSISVTEYSKLYGCSARNVTKNLSKGIGMAYMRRFKKSGATWIIEVDKEWYQSKQQLNNQNA